MSNFVQKHFRYIFVVKSDVAVQTLEKCNHPVVEAPKADDVPGRTFMEALVEHFAA